MKVLVIQHSAGDSPATVHQWLDQPGVELQCIRVDQGDPMPNRVDADALMTFGGSFSLARRVPPAWVAEEQRLIRQYVEADRKVLGICLGSQMVAAALGATVRPNPTPEVGWHVVRRVAGSRSHLADKVFSDEMTVLQWHQDTFDIPPGATHLFESDACRHQAFSIDDRVFGMQFHLEANERTLAIFMAVSKWWDTPQPHVQSRQSIEEGQASHSPAQQRLMLCFLNHWLGAPSSGQAHGD